MKLKKPYILIVEDEHEVARIIQQEIESDLDRGLVAVVTPRFSDALTKLNNQKFACIVLDLQLIQGSGDRIIEELHKDRNNPNHSTPILVVSGNLDMSYMAQFKDKIAGAFVKPFDVKKLGNKIRDLAYKT